MDNKPSSIGTLKENSLHASLKSWLSQEGDCIECPVKGYMIDIVHGNLLIEIQTRNFYSMKKKLSVLLDDYAVHLVYPIAAQKWIAKEDPLKGAQRRKSPRRGKAEDVFYELVRISTLPRHPNFSLQLLFVDIEEIQVPADQVSYTASWRRKGWAVADRKLLSVKDQMVFSTVSDYLAFLEPLAPDEPFTVKDLSRARKIPDHLSSKIVYTLCAMGVVEKIGKQGRKNTYQRVILQGFIMDKSVDRSPKP
jgi:hypothetical protein